MKQFGYFLTTLIALLGAVMVARGETYDPERYQLLVIDSYGEEERWNREAIPALVKIAVELGTKVRVEHLDGEHITSDSAYHAHANDLMRRVITKPHAVMFVGNLAFNLRDQIQARWPGMPMLLMGEEDFVAPLSHYIGDSHVSTPDSLKVPLTELRDRYDFTYVNVPYQYEKTIDLMVEMLPKMEKLIFVSDRYYMNREVDKIMREHVEKNYPHLQYEHLVATLANRDELLASIGGEDPTRGVILSSGIFSSIAPFRHPLLTSRDIYKMYRMDQLFFTYREPFISGGEFVGGWVYDSDEMTNILIADLTKMLTERKASDIPFGGPTTVYPMLDYDSMQAAFIPMSLAPANARFINKPETFWTAYRNTLINIGFVLLAVLGVLLTYYLLRNRRLRLLKHHEELLRNMPLAYSAAEVVVDPVTGEPRTVVFKDQNPKFLRLISSADTAESADGIVHSDNPFRHERVLSLCKAVVEKHKPLEFAQYFNFNDTFYEFILSPSERPNFIDIYGIDITLHHRDSEKLRDSYKMLQLILGSSRLISWVLDIPTGRIRFDYNSYHSFTKFFAYLMDRGMEISIDEWIKNIHPDDLRRFKEAYRRLTEGVDKLMHVEYRLHYKGGDDPDHVEWVEVNAAVSRYDSKGIPVSIVGSSAVITAGKRAEHDREVDADHRATRGRFLANVINEFRAPVNKIMRMSEVMSECDDQRVRRNVNRDITRTGSQLLQLYNDVVLMISLDEGISEFNFSMVDVNELMRTIEAATVSHLHRGVELRMELGMEKCHSMMATHSAEHVMVNLLLNSCRYTPAGSIIFGYERRGAMLYFYVRDTGVGIPPKVLPHIFERFSHGDEDADTGLSLAICKSIVEHLGGEIGVESEGIGKGTTFWFTVPYRPEGDTMEVKVTPERSAAPVRRTILVAEPSDSDYILLKYILSKDYDIIRAVDGAHAVDLYRQHKPDMVIVAINMPKADGFEVLRIFREADQAIPVVAVSTYEYSAASMMERGFTDFISKTDSADQILQKVRRAFMASKGRPQVGEF